MKKIYIYQIYYDRASKEQIDLNFIPLDNSNGPSEWFEFYPILNFLKNNTLIENCWYGFLSPKFSIKTGVSSNYVLKILNKYTNTANVALFSPNWDQLAYFRNPFEQGEFRHPGLLDIAQDFINQSTYKVDLRRLVTHSSTSVFSNYVIAKPEYWLAWLDMAIQFHQYAESKELGETSYLDASSKMGPMKTFIQERLASIVLTNGDFKTLAMDFGQSNPILDELFDNSPRVRKMLQTCDLLKEKFCKTRDESYLKMYFMIRNDIHLKQQHPRYQHFLDS